MSMKILSIALLLLSVVGCASSTPRNRRLPSKAILCCTKVSTDNITKEIITKTYERQYANGDTCVDAIIFRINSGRVCVDPNRKWVKDLIGKMELFNL